MFDIEADKWINFVVLGFFDGVEYRTFDNVKKFVRHLNQKKFDGWKIYAHFGGKYDFLFLLEELFNLTSDVRIIERNGRIITMTVRARNATFHLSDSYALLPASLKKLTAAFGVEHEKGEYDFSKGVRLSARLLKYLESDVLGLYEVIRKFSETAYIDGEVKNTIGSQALHVFKTHFSPGHIETIPLQYEETFRKNFYSGGRVEVYKGHGKKIHTYDVNSLYPSVMLTDMPTGAMKTTSRYERGKIGFYCVEVVSTPDFYIPPYLVKTDFKNYFVNGKGTYFFSSATLDYLREMYGVRFRVKYGFVFSGRGRIFNPFIEHYYKVKTESTDPTLTLIAKLFLNSLYGKLGQSRHAETVVGHVKGASFRVDDHLSHFGLVLVDSVSKSRYILPYLAAYITELARLEHWKYMQVDPDGVFYGDTDSIYTQSTKLKRFVGPGIGQLKDEGTYEGIFLLPKTYALRNADEDVVSFKGFDAAKFHYRHFEAALKNRKPLKENRERLLSFRECFTRKNGVQRERGFFLKMTEMKKSTDITAYDKRAVIPSRSFDFDTQAHYINDIIQP